MYVITVRKDAKPATIIGKVQAKDHDSGENARLTYTMDTETDSETASFFSIGQDSGSITLLKELDNEQAKYYAFYVIAEDHGLPKKKDTAKVEIRVEDVNDNDSRRRGDHVKCQRGHTDWRHPRHRSCHRCQRVVQKTGPLNIH